MKGRFAFGYATHKDRIKALMIRDSINEPWTEVSWDEALSFAANKLKSVQQNTVETPWVVYELAVLTKKPTCSKTHSCRFWQEYADTCAVSVTAQPAMA